MGEQDALAVARDLIESFNARDWERIATRLRPDRGARFSSDVSVTGTARLDVATNTLDAQVTVDGPGKHDGTLSFHGVLFDPGKPTAQVHGVIRGRPLALLVPTN